MQNTPKSGRTTAIMAQRLAGGEELDIDTALRDDTPAILRIARPDAAILDRLQQRFQLDELHIKDLLNPEHPPLYEYRTTVHHLILRFPVEEKEELSMASMSLLLDEKLLVLLWPEQRYIMFRDEQLIAADIFTAASRVIHALVDRLYHRSLQLAEALEESEDECLSDPENADLGQILRLRHDLALIARVARANWKALDDFSARNGEHDNPHLSDAREHMQRTYNLAAGKAEHALTVMQAVQSLVGQRLNETMKFLAAITVILTPMAIITGIFGMNFAHMQVLQSPWGFSLTLWSLLLIGILLGVVFRKKNWL
jgi:magnesium transporter